MIEWTDATSSPWWGCTPIGTGCKHCYAATLAGKYKGLQYRKGVPRLGRLDAFEADAQRLNRKALRENQRIEIFPSMMDLFDGEVEEAWLNRALEVIASADALIWQILTKRASRLFELAELGVLSRLRHVWWGVSVSDQDSADEQLGLLLRARPYLHPDALTWCSYEPAVGPVDFRTALWVGDEGGWEYAGSRRRMLDWIVVGGESGSGARVCSHAWIQSAIQQAEAAGVPIFVKQLGDSFMSSSSRLASRRWVTGARKDWTVLRGRRGADVAYWPPELRVREKPQGRRHG